MTDDYKMELNVLHNTIRYGTLENLKEYFNTNYIANIFQISILPCKVPFVFYVSNVSKLKFLIEKGFDIHYKIPANGRNILFHNNNYKVVNYLIQLGLDPNIKDDYGNNVLIGLKSIKLAKMYVEKYNVDINNNNIYNGNALMINKNLNMIKYYVENGCNVKQLDRWGRPNWYFHMKSEKIFKYLIDNDSPTDSYLNNGTGFIPAIFTVDMIKRLDYIITSKNVDLNEFQDFGEHNAYFCIKTPKLAQYCYKKGLKFHKSRWNGYPFASIYPDCPEKMKLYLAKLFIYDKLVFWAKRNQLKTLLHRYTPETRKNKNKVMNDILYMPPVSCFPGGQLYLETEKRFYNNINFLKKH